jgi:hypothetical protein
MIQDKKCVIKFAAWNGGNLLCQNVREEAPLP